MKNLKEYIIEHKTTDEIKIFDNGKEIFPIDYFYDKESFDEMIVQNKFEKGTLKLVKQQNNKWITLNDEAKINTMQPSGDYLVQGLIKLSYDELINDLETGKYILILI